MATYHIDFETRSRCDIKLGAFRYANDPSTEILCVAIAKDDEEPVVWKRYHHNAHSDVGYNEEAEELLYQAAGPDAVVYAHNAMFECAISDALWEQTFHLPPPRHTQWRCTMAMARRAGLPASLGKCAEALGLTQQKDTKGAALIRKFSIPQKKTGEFIQPEDDPAAFKEFCEYCRQDVRVEQQIHQKLRSFELKGFALDTYQLDMDINTRGIPVNLAALRNADRIIDEESERLAAAFQKITGLAPTQNAKVLQWMKDNGFEGDNLQAETLDEALEEVSADPDSLLGRALSLKKQISYASLKKVKSMIACAGPHDNRVRGSLNYYGAGTGRWSASLIQPQNFKKPSKHLEKYTESIYQDIIDGCNADYLHLVYGPPLECISSCIRHFIHDTGREFLDADYSAIEARIAAWQAGEEWKVEVFQTHGRIYEAVACRMYGLTLADFDEHKATHGGHHPYRQKGKQGELSCTYQGGVNALIKMGALRDGIKKEELPAMVRDWREACPATVQLWYDAENAAKSAVRQPGQRFGFGVGCEMFCARTAGIDYLFMRLPSGRRLAYPHPRIEKQVRWTTVNKVTGEEVQHTTMNPTPEDLRKAREKDPKARIGDALTYWGQVPMKTSWGRISLYGGKFVENCITGDMEVLTPTGWVALANLTDEQVWDGHDFVRHEGLMYQGVKEAITKDGITATPDHKFLTTHGWVSFEKACTSSFAPVVLPPSVAHQLWDRESWRTEKLRRVYDIRNCGPRHQFVIRSPYTGRLGIAHNCVQGIAADVMAVGAHNAWKAGYEICMLVHDQAIAHRLPGQTIEDFIGHLTRMPAWADGLPLAAAGGVVPFYRKD